MNQSINKSTKSNVHVKVEYNQEYRRFQVETLSFEHLQNTLRTLLNIDPAQPVKILFLDDEKDWVLLTSDSELAHAWELSPTLLRLTVKPCASPTLVSIPHLPVVPASATVCEAAAFAHPFMRGGPCRGRGGRGGKGRCDPSMRIQFFENKLVRLTEKRDALKAKVAGMPEDRARAVSWRISHLENKIENIKWKKEHFAKLAQMVEEPNEVAVTCCNEEIATTTEETPAPTECPYGFKGGRGRGGCHGRWGGQRGNKWGEGEACPRQRAWENPLFVTVQERKAELKAARKGGNQEEIQAKWEAVQEAKDTWQQAKRAQWAAKKQAK